MSHPEVNRVLDEVIADIQDIDNECKTLLNNIEHGLVNVKWEFGERAQGETGKKRLTEETIIAWLLCQKQHARARNVYWEHPYPKNRRRKCDIVVEVGASTRLWLELKLAWKAWFNCEGDPVYRNSFYRSYLRGDHRTHSFRHDLEKLAYNGENWSADDCRAVCLVGFDCIKEPMDDEVAAIVQNNSQTWRVLSGSHWADRRCPELPD